MWVSFVDVRYAGPLQSHRKTGFKINKAFRMANEWEIVNLESNKNSRRRNLKAAKRSSWRPRKMLRNKYTLTLKNIGLRIFYSNNTNAA